MGSGTDRRRAYTEKQKTFMPIPLSTEAPTVRQIGHLMFYDEYSFFSTI